MKYKFAIAAILMLAGLILILDEIWMFFPGLGWPGWIIGDWSAWHIEPYHHWMLGVVFLIGGAALVRR